MVADPAQSLAAAFATLRDLPEPDGEAHERRRREAALALDAAQALGGVKADAVDPVLLKPPWRSERVCAAAARASGPGDDAWDVDACRRRLCGVRPRAGPLLSWLDERAEALEPYRRLSEARHAPWAEHQRRCPHDGLWHRRD